MERKVIDLKTNEIMELIRLHENDKELMERLISSALTNLVTEARYEIYKGSLPELLKTYCS